MVKVMKRVMKKSMKKLLGMSCAALYVLSMGFGNTTGVSDVYADGDKILIEQQAEDINVIPDTYNTGVDSSVSFTKYVGVDAKDADIDVCTPIVATSGSNSYNIGIKKSNGDYVIDFGAKQNANLPERIEVTNYDFTDFYFRTSREDFVTTKKTIVFKNCIIYRFSRDKFDRNITYEFYNCTIRRYEGSNALFRNCFFGGSTSDPLVPFRNIDVKDCFFGNLNHPSTDPTHIDCTQMYGHKYYDKATQTNKTLDVENVKYKNCRFMVPNILYDNGNQATVNACMMIQLEYASGNNISVEDCIMNGGSYTIYCQSTAGDIHMNNVKLINNRVGAATSHGAVYPTNIDPDAEFQGLRGTDSLYVSSVYKENGKTYFYVTNDTPRERKLKVITSKGEYDFTVKACPKGKTEENEDGFHCSYSDFPIDVVETINEDCSYAVCLDVTDDNNVKQIRFVNYAGSPVYIDKSYMGTGYNQDVIVNEGPLGTDLTYTVTRTASNEYILRISGKGQMPGFNKLDTPPWSDYTDYLTKIFVEDGVENISSFVFFGSFGVTDIELPDSITIIDKYSFANCASIKKINIPASVKTIGERAFLGAQLVNADGTLKKETSNSGTDSGEGVEKPDDSNVNPSNENDANNVPKDVKENNNNDSSSSGNGTSGGAAGNGGSGDASGSGAAGTGEAAQAGTSYSSEWVNGYWYNADGSQTYPGVMEWKSNSKGWWIEDTTGWYPVSTWQKINGYWYYFDYNGYMASSEWVDGYWLGSDGAWVYAETGSWNSDKTGWWFGDTSGWYAAGRWQKINGYWYYFNSSGYMVTNKYIDGYWLNGSGQYTGN